MAQKPKRKKTPRDCPVCGGIGKLMQFGAAGMEIVGCAECDEGRMVPASADDKELTEEQEVA